MVKQVRIVLEGKVQGVFFRDFAKQNANKMGLVGYAKNLNNGKLEIVAQGQENKIDEFVKLCKRGPIFSKVNSVDIIEEQVEHGEYGFFDIRFS